MLGNTRFIFRVELDISLVRCAHSWDIMFNTRNKSGISKHPCIILYIVQRDTEKHTVRYFPYLQQWRYRSRDFFQFAFEREISQFFAWDFTLAWIYDFYLILVLKTIFYSLAALVRKILFSQNAKQAGQGYIE
jgi:hypothetical protein